MALAAHAVCVEYSSGNEGGRKTFDPGMIAVRQQGRAIPPAISPHCGAGRCSGSCRARAVLSSRLCNSLSELRAPSARRGSRRAATGSAAGSAASPAPPPAAPARRATSPSTSSARPRTRISSSAGAALPPHPPTHARTHAAPAGSGLTGPASRGSSLRSASRSIACRAHKSALDCARGSRRPSHQPPALCCTAQHV